MRRIIGINIYRFITIAFISMLFGVIIALAIVVRKNSDDIATMKETVYRHDLRIQVLQDNLAFYTNIQFPEVSKEEKK